MENHDNNFKKKADHDKAVIKDSDSNKNFQDEKPIDEILNNPYKEIDDFLDYLYEKEQMKKKIEPLRLLAEKGDPDAQCKLGAIYTLLDRDTQDNIEAFNWYKKAAIQGELDAQMAISSRYYDGQGVKKDLHKAAEWCLKVANQGDAFAQYMYGHFCFEGKGVAEDKSEAVRWFIKAANQGQKSAQNKLMECYYYGYGVPVDNHEAAKWLKKIRHKK